MMATGRKHCAFAQDGTCKFSEEHCRICKIEPEDSAFHKRLGIGALTWNDITMKQMKDAR